MGLSLVMWFSLLAQLVQQGQALGYSAGVGAFKAPCFRLRAAVGGEGSLLVAAGLGALAMWQSPAFYIHPIWTHGAQPMSLGLLGEVPWWRWEKAWPLLL